jgi:uncharacterized membrane protein
VDGTPRGDLAAHLDSRHRRSGSAVPTPPPAGGASRHGDGLDGVRVRVTATESVAASLTFAASLTPALYPRPVVVQAVLTGIALVVGRLMVRGVASVLPAAQRVAGARPRRWSRRAARLLALFIAVSAVVLNYRWQLDVRTLMDMPGEQLVYLLTMLPIAAVTAYGLTLAGRVAVIVPRAYGRLAERAIPGRRRLAVHAVVAVVLAVLVTDVVIAGRIVGAMNDRLIAANDKTGPDVVPPGSPWVSGTSASLVPWATLGRMGRSFVAATPPVADLAEWNGRPAMPPIRSYVGLDSAPGVRARVELAMDELERTGAFERDVLVVITPTGTGSVNGHAVAPLEYLHNGNIASVAVQYSYLPSWLVMGGNQQRAVTTARALFAAVERRLSQQPEEDRPLLLVYGESLGSFGGEQIFSDLADMRNRVDGALWIGPPRANRLWRELTTNRDTGSPVWQPVYGEGDAVRFTTDGEDLQESIGDWGRPRVVYLQHGSDPVTWWSPKLLFERPEWLGATRPPDISHRTPYVPVVTFVQTTIDTVLGGSAPMHHGHVYGTEQAVAWAAIAPPPGWSVADTRRLVTSLSEQ